MKSLICNTLNPFFDLFELHHRGLDRGIHLIREDLQLVAATEPREVFHRNADHLTHVRVDSQLDETAYDFLALSMEGGWAAHVEWLIF